MEGAFRKIITRGRSKTSEPKPLNNQRPPEIAEYVRVRVKPKAALNNIHTHGWITLQVEEVYILPTMDKGEELYLIKGQHNKGEIFIQLTSNKNEQDLDMRARSGWDIAEENHAEDPNHQERLENSQHEDNFTLTQRVLTKEEYIELLVGSKDTKDLRDQNDRQPNSQPTPPTRGQRRLSIPQTHQPSQQDGNKYEAPDKMSSHRYPSLKTPSCPSRVSTPDPTDGKGTHSDTTGSNTSQCLGTYLTDNLATVIGDYGTSDFGQIPELSETIALERSLIKHTNDLENFLLEADWMGDENEIKGYMFKRNRWVRIGEQYLRQKKECSNAVKTCIENPFISSNTREQLANLSHDMVNDVQFMNLLKQTDNALLARDEIVKKSEIDASSKGSLFSEPDSTYSETRFRHQSNSKEVHPSLRGLYDEENKVGKDVIVNLMRSPLIRGTAPATPHVISPPTDSNVVRGVAPGTPLGGRGHDVVRGSTPGTPLGGRGHDRVRRGTPGLPQGDRGQNIGRGRGGPNLSRGTTHGIFQDDSNLQQRIGNDFQLGGTGFNVGAGRGGTNNTPTHRPLDLDYRPSYYDDQNQFDDAAPILNTKLEELLHENIEDISYHIIVLNKQIMKHSDKMKGKTPNKHTEETFKGLEEKVTRLRQEKTKYADTYSEYVAKYAITSTLSDIGDKLKNLSAELKILETNLEKFGDQAIPDIGYVEVSYAQYRDVKAPELNVEVFKGDTSLQNYVQWLLNNSSLPRNLINSNISKTLPSLILLRLNQQHPEDSRQTHDIITFLLREHGRPPEVEIQLRDYHRDIGSLNSLVMSGNDCSIVPSKCKEAQINADK